MADTRKIDKRTSKKRRFAELAAASIAARKKTEERTFSSDKTSSEFTGESADDDYIPTPNQEGSACAMLFILKSIEKLFLNCLLLKYVVASFSVSINNIGGQMG